MGFPTNTHPVLTDEERDHLASIGSTIRFGADSMLVKEGEDTDFVFLILSGHVKIVKGEKRRFAALRGPGEIVAELSAVTGQSRTATVTSLNPLEALHLSAQQWRDFLFAHPRAMFAQLAASGLRLQEATQRETETVLGSEQRLARTLIELHDKDVIDHEDGSAIVRLNQRELADFARLSRESVVQVMRQFRAAELVVTGRSFTALHNVDHLRRIADGHTTMAADIRR